MVVAALREEPFPWLAAILLAAICDLLLVASFAWREYCSTSIGLWNLTTGALEIAILVGGLLLIYVGLLHIIYLVVKFPGFWRD